MKSPDQSDRRDIHAEEVEQTPFEGNEAGRMDALTHRCERLGVQNVDLRTDEGKLDAAGRIDQRILERVASAPSLDRMPAHIAQKALREAADEVRRNLQALRSDVTKQQLITFLGLPLTGMLAAGLSHYHAASSEAPKFEQFENSLEAFYRLLQRSGVQVGDLIPKFEEMSKPGHSYLTTLLLPFARGFHRIRTKKQLTQAMRDMDAAIDRAEEMIARISAQVN